MRPLAADVTQAAEAEEEELEEKSEEYSEEMQKRMGGFLTYRHEDGMNFAHVLDNLIVGSCLQKPADLDRLVDEEGVGTIYCLQKNSDMEWFQLDVRPIQARAAERGDVKHVRYPIRDFDAFDVRMQLPRAVALLLQETNAGRGKSYVHCTAGLGRAPATALAYMYWCRGMSLKEAHSLLTGVRPCNPNLAAIRAATCDLLFDKDSQCTVRIAVRRSGNARSIQVAGLDVGWGQPLDMTYDVETHRFVLDRALPPGRFPFKLIVDGRWTYSADHPTYKDNDNINNYVDVVPDISDSGVVAARKRLLSEECNLTTAEREIMMRELLAMDVQPSPGS
ncbi:hypothetical protein WJX72_011109 [[Myrmecia] bisecta]|uniref:Uncharacterized protein n=1 Tax=[Myrmecia] bisecta TaxID=41462 RepID=A0AAW1QGF9_9CHLO